ncbi:MAG: hypothetical protein AAFX09_13730 [Pseudomonadota bacterium]
MPTTDTIESHDHAPADLKLLREAKLDQQMDRIHERAHRVEDRLTKAIDGADDAFRSYVHFQKTRGRVDGKPLPQERQLIRAASYPASHVMTFSILAGLILVEGLINAQFFAKGSDLGLLGGWIQAITVAFTNVIAAFFLIGFLCVRGLFNPDRPFSFAAAAIGLPLAVGGIIFLNFTAAHYRDLLEINAAALALGDFTQTGEYLAPVSRALSFSQFETLEALLLFVLGLTFAAIAAFKGATFDDRIIGYGTEQRRFERATAHLAAVLKQTPRETRMLGDDDARFQQPRRAQALLDEISAYRGQMRRRVIGETGAESEAPPFADAQGR